MAENKYKSYLSHTREKFYERSRRLMPGRYANALYINVSDPSYYEKRLRCNRHDVQALYYLGRKYEQQGYWQRAREYYERAVLVNSHFEPAIGALILLHRKQVKKEQQALVQSQTKKKKRKPLSLSQMMGAVLMGYLMMLVLLFGVILQYWR
jgi:tetratricopeptide (TPR) repeat protein